METLRQIVWVADWVVFGFFVLVAVSYTTATLLALPALLKLRRWSSTFYVDEVAASATSPPITLIAPMYNEAMVCVEAVRALLGVDYPTKDVLVVADGCKDDTVERLIAAFDMEEAMRSATATIPTAAIRTAYRSRSRPDLWLIDKENGGKADAINVGINHCRTPLLCTLDGDSLLGPDALHRIVQPFLKDATTIAAGGTIGIVNDCTVRFGRVTRIQLPNKWIPRFQVLEYIRAFASARVGWNAAHALPLISGAFGLFRREALVAVGGLDTDATGEDFEVTARLHRHYREAGIPYKIEYVPDAVSWTECPSDLKVLGKQRDRWHKGGMEVMWKHRAMLLNPRYGRIGMVSLPVFFIVEMMGPVIEVCGYVAFALSLWLGIINVPMAALLLALAFVLGLAQSIAALALEQYAFRRYTSLPDLLMLLALTVVENLGYRQLTVWWRVRGFWKFLRGDTSWGEMTRSGFNTADPA
ncbi:hypothetical protein BSZ36_13310 [Rubricoccus marinus]|uniref:Glycosyl transferase n=2 Tax=Rubricoccus marinus TaxID=716817 RepID=A0A259U209_9BACT|nr:hypothetical protein BSZ36_13310 [Rubricoccus marinus]